MISPISSEHTSAAASQPSPEKTKHPAQAPPTAKSGAVSSDQVTLKSAGQVDSDNQ